MQYKDLSIGPEALENLPSFMELSILNGFLTIDAVYQKQLKILDFIASIAFAPSDSHHLSKRLNFIAR